MDPLAFTEIVGIVLCLVGIAFFSLSESSLVATNKIRLRQYLDEEETDAEAGERVERMSGESQQMLATVIVGINIPVLVASALATHLTASKYPHDEHLLEIVSICMIAVILVFCEILPKSYAFQRAEPVAVRVSRAMELLVTVMHYPTRLVMWICQTLIRLLGGGCPDLSESVTEEDLKELVEVGGEEGVLEEDERRLLDSVFEFGETVAREVMSPRTDMVCVAKESTLHEVLEVISDSGHSRVPMYDGQIDNLLGVVYLNDMLGEIVAGNEDLQPAQHLREPVFVPETKNIDELFRELQAQKIHIAIVVDEHGGVSGLITMEDLLEEIFGEIRDEHDGKEEPLVVPRPDGAFHVDGRATIDEVEDEVGLELPDGEFDTLAGLLSDLAGRLPEEGETFRAAGGTFTVLEVEDHRIRKVEVCPGK